MNTASSIFMVVTATFFLLLFGLPIFLSPMTWARRIGWEIPDDTDLANYLGRSLGALALPSADSHSRRSRVDCPYLPGHGKPENSTF
jgi:hypothetical protein